MEATHPFFEPREQTPWWGGAPPAVGADSMVPRAFAGEPTQIKVPTWLQVVGCVAFGAVVAGVFAEQHRLHG